MIHRAMIHTECFPQLFTEFGKVLASHCIMSFLVPIFLGLVTKGIYNRYCHPLSKFPGPFWGSCTDLYLVFIIGSIPTYGYELHEKYGTISIEKKKLLVASNIFYHTNIRYIRPHRSPRPEFVVIQ